MADEQLQNDVPSAGEPRPSRPLDRFSTRVVCLVFLATLLTAGLVSWISLDAIRGQLLRQAEVGFRSLVELRRAEMDGYLDVTRAELARSVRAGDALERLSSGGAAGEALLAELLDAHTHFSGLAVVRDGGEVIARAGSVSPRVAAGLAAARTGGDRGGLARAFVIRDARPSVGSWIASAPGRQGSVRLAAIHRLEPLRALLEPGPDDGPGRIVLTDHTGRGLAWTGGGGAPAIPIRKLPAAGQRGLGRFTRDDGVAVFAVAEPLRGARLHVVAEAPRAIVHAPMRSLVRRTLLADLVIVAFFSLLAYRVTAVIMRPVEALAEGAARVAHGDLLHEIPTPSSNDEVGRLARSINDMMHRLRRSQDEIERDKRRLTEQNEDLQRANEVLAQLSITDGLTRLHNHRFFQDHLTREIKRVDRTGEPLSMVLMDIDDFKRMNDRQGHAVGDQVLMNVAERLNESIRESDLLARYGGEEFVVLTPNTDIEGALALAEKIRMSVESMPLIVGDSMRPLRATLSCGVAQYCGDRKHFFQAADRALYRAKAEGKNCVVAAPLEA